MATLACAAAVVLGSAASATAATEPGGWQKAFNVTAWTAGGYGSDTARTALDELQRLGTNRIVLTPTWYMGAASSDTIAPDAAKTPSDSSIRTIASEARERGMSVVLKPHVDVRDGTFRGQIAPASSAAWFASYGAFLTHYADLAQAIGADTLVVGTELTSMSGDTAAWDRLVAMARAHFSGTLTYAANWVDEAEDVGFWNRLDAVGIDAYMPLQTGADTRPTVAQLATAWTPYVERITALHAATGKPVLFTELGYQSRSDTLDHPASSSGSPDPAIQAVAYAAALRVWSAVPWFDGIWWWNWEAEPTGEDVAGSFAIAEKPAAEVLRDAQGGTAVPDGVAVRSGAGRAGTTVPLGVGVVLLLALSGLAVVRHRRRSDPGPGPAPRPTPVAPWPTAPTAPPARTVITAQDPAPRPVLRAVSIPAARPGNGLVVPGPLVADLPPKLAAACLVHTPGPAASAEIRLSGRGAGVAA